MVFIPNTLYLPKLNILFGEVAIMVLRSKLLLLPTI